MFFEFSDYKYCINCDWLQYSVMTIEHNPALRIPSGYRIELVQGNNVFKRRALVFDGMGRKVLTLLWVPFSSRLKENLMTVQVANEFLYGGLIHESFRLLSLIVDCSFNSMGRIDLCCDFELTDERLELLFDLNNGDAYIERKKEGSIWFHDGGVRDGFQRKMMHCMAWGSPSSEIKLKIYNKSRELGLIGGVEEDEDNHKPWIISEWKSIGMDIKKVWRVEFSVAGANQMRTSNHAILLDDVASSEWQMNTFFDFYHKRCVIRKNEGKINGHHNGNKRLHLLELPTKGNHLKWFEGKPQSPINSNAIPIVRSMMTRITEPAIMVNDEVYTSYASSIMQIVERNGLRNWFERRYGNRPQEYFEELYQSVGTQMIEDYVDAKKFFD